MSGWVYFGFTVALFAVLVGIIIHYYNPKEKEKVEKPKYRIFDEDDR